MAIDAIHNLDRTQDSTEPQTLRPVFSVVGRDSKLGKLFSTSFIPSSWGVDIDPPSVFSPPTPVLDVLDTSKDKPSKRLPY
jgi:hypothetical protein